MQTEKGWKTGKETANALRIGINQCYRAIERGEIRGIRIGNSIRVPDSELDRLQYGENSAA
jgi:excisionase family DNA binding protein